MLRPRLLALPPCLLKTCISFWWEIFPNTTTRNVPGQTLQRWLLAMVGKYKVLSQAKPKGVPQKSIWCFITIQINLKPRHQSGSLSEGHILLSPMTSSMIQFWQNKGYYPQATVLTPANLSVVSPRSCIYGDILEKVVVSSQWWKDHVRRDPGPNVTNIHVTKIQLHCMPLRCFLKLYAWKELLSKVVERYLTHTYVNINYCPPLLSQYTKWDGSKERKIRLRSNNNIKIWPCIMPLSPLLSNILLAIYSDNILCFICILCL